MVDGEKDMAGGKADGMRKKSKLAFKMAVGIVLLGTLICAVSSLIGYHQYKNAIEKQYNTKAYQCAEVALSYVEPGKLREYADLVNAWADGTISKEEIARYREEESYRQTWQRIETLRQAMGANDVFLFALDTETLLSYAGTRDGWTPLRYIFDSYTVPEYSYTLGDCGSFNPEYIQELYQIAVTGERSDNYFFSDGDYGYNTAAIAPVLDENGEVFAFAAVEIPMVTLKASLRQYLIYAVLITVTLIVLFILAYVMYLYRHVVRPINRIAQGTGAFVENNNHMSDMLAAIKTNDEIQELAESVIKMEADIGNYIENLTKVTAEKERIGAELDVATNIQKSMLPSIFPAFPDREEVDIYATMNPAKEVGGDFYDFFMVDKGHLAIVMADVSGKGVPAALFMVIGKTLIKDHTQPGKDLGEVFSEVNDLLCESNSEGLFITAFEGVLDLVTGEFRYVNAGHEIPFICKKDGVFEPYKIRAAFVLAGMEGMKYKCGSMQLAPGDKVFQYTDGVTEATNDKEELFGMERLGGVLQRNAGLPPQELLPKVKAEIDGFVGEAPQFDDITMLCLEYKKRMEEEAG